MADQGRSKQRPYMPDHGRNRFYVAAPAPTGRADSSGV